jgi:predicted aspartyl protease
MGEVSVEVELENFVDRVNADQEMISPGKVRSFRVTALVDTGAVMNMLPRDVIEHLGVPLRGTAIVTLADERKEEFPVAAGVTFKIPGAVGRTATLDCIVGPPRSEPLLGQILLEELDLLVDAPGQRLVPNPSSPIYPSLKMK